MSGLIEKEVEAQLDAQSQLEELKKERDELFALHNSNLTATVAAIRKSNDSSKLKSDLKKTTAFVKKIKSINVEGLQQCIRDSETLNLTLYISEVVAAIAETNYKATDIPSMVKLCISLHRRYEEFTTGLISNLRSLFLSSSNDDDKEFAKKKRILIRFAIELYQVGVWPDADFFVEILRTLLGKSKFKAGKQSVDLLGLGTFFKYGCEILIGFTPRNIASIAKKAGKTLADIPSKLLAGQSANKEMQAITLEIYSQLCQDLLKASKDYKSKEKKFEKDKLLHGSTTEQKQADLENAKRLFEKLYATVLGFAECSEFDLPELIEEKEEDDETKGISLFEGSGGLSVAAQQIADYGPWGDAETKAFYEDLPDLLSLVPLTALGITPEQAAALKETWKAQRERLALGAGMTEEGGTAAGEDSSLVDQSAAANGSGNESDVSGKDDDFSNAAGADSTVDESDGKGVAASDDAPHVKLMALLQEKLPECTTKQKADEFCVSFCYLNSKGARKRLVAALLKIPRSRSELTATYARIIASLQRVFGDISKPIMETLAREFYGQLKNSKSNQYMESRIRTVRFAAELIKFGVCPPITAFKMFTLMFKDFNSQNVELVSILLENCGRYLYLLPYTYDRMVEVLETTVRLQRVKNLDSRLQTLLEMAYFAVMPPERVQREVKVYSTVQKYARYLVVEKLDSPSVSVDDVILSIRRLPWSDAVEMIEEHVAQAFIHMARNKYVSIPNLADCLSGLLRNVPNLCIRVVDRLLEEIQRGLDSPHKREPQSLLGIVRFIGELYNYSMLSTAIIFDLLYYVINYGHNTPTVNTGAALTSSTGTVLKLTSRLRAPGSMFSTAYYDPRIPSEIDSPTDLFRAQIVCEILDTCGGYYVTGISKDKLAKFLTYFQKYLLTKSSIPMHVEFTILDTFDQLEELAREAVEEASGKKKSALKDKKSAPNTSIGLIFPRYDSLDDVQAAIQTLEATAAISQSGVDENEEDDEEEIRAPLRGEKGAQVNDNKEDDEGKGENDSDENSDNSDDDSDDSDSDDGDTDETAARKLESMRAKEEDEEFEKAFKNLMQQSVESVKMMGGASKATVDINRMAIPAVLPKPKNVSTRNFDDDDDDDDDDHPKNKRMPFKLLGRDGKGRIETRQLMVPEEAPMVAKLLKSEAQMKIEKQKLKEKVLAMETFAMETEYLEDKPVYLAQPQHDFPGPQQQAYRSVGPGNSNGQGYIGRAGGGGAGIVNPGRGYGGGGRFRHHPDPARRATGENDLNLDQFLAEANANEIRRMKH